MQPLRVYRFCAIGGGAGQNRMVGIRQSDGIFEDDPHLLHQCPEIPLLYGLGNAALPVKHGVEQALQQLEALPGGQVRQADTVFVPKVQAVRPVLLNKHAVCGIGQPCAAQNPGGFPANMHLRLEGFQQIGDDPHTELHGIVLSVQWEDGFLFMFFYFITFPRKKEAYFVIFTNSFCHTLCGFVLLEQKSILPPEKQCTLGPYLFAPSDATMKSARKAAGRKTAAHEKE